MALVVLALAVLALTDLFNFSKSLDSNSFVFVFMLLYKFISVT